MRKTPEEEWESLQDERRDYEDIEELKDTICGWLDDSIQRGLPEDAKVTSATTDDKFYFLINDVVLTHPENTERQDLLFSIERVEGQTEETTK
jgi:hypothetical protein